MINKQPRALQIIQDWEAIHNLETAEIEQLAWESCTELQRLHDANVELIEALKANQIAEAMPIYGDISDFVWPKSEMRKPGDTAWGWICEKHGLGYQSGCVCCREDFDNYRKRKDQDARYERDKALREASEKARKALEKHGETQ